MTFGIQMRGDDGLPTLYSISVARQFGTPHGWTAERDQALQFAREIDATQFLAAFLPHQAPFCTVIPLPERIS